MLFRSVRKSVTEEHRAGKPVRIRRRGCLLYTSFTATAEKMKAAGYNMVSSVNDTYRVYSNNVSGKWVQDGKIVIDDNLMKWVDDSKKMVYNHFYT